MTSKQINGYWDRISKIAEKYGYSEYAFNDINLGTGSDFYKDGDIFAPLIKYIIWNKESVSIHIQDRNGNDIMHGPTCAVHTLNDCKDFKERFEMICSYVFEKYSKYSKQNRLDFVFNEIKQERIDWNQK